MHRTAKSRRIGWNDGGLTVLIGDSKANAGEGTHGLWPSLRCGAILA
jgi:hypothetical protein